MLGAADRARRTDCRGTNRISCLSFAEILASRYTNLCTASSHGVLYLAFALSAQSYGAAPRRLPSVPQSDAQVAEAVPVERAPKLDGTGLVRLAVSRAF